MAYKHIPEGKRGSFCYLKKPKNKNPSFTLKVLFCTFTQGLPGSEITSLLVKGLGGLHSLFFIVVRTDTGKRLQEHSNKSCEF
jgi:hypothetical protein